MAQLTPEQQTFIVAEFARNKSGGQIVKSVKNEFGLELDRQQVWHYHPDNPALAAKWKTLYGEVRAKVLEDVLGVAGAHRGFRLRELMELYWRAKEMNNIVFAAELMKQMAQEVGEVFTNKRTLSVNPRDALAEMLGVSPDDLPDANFK